MDNNPMRRPSLLLLPLLFVASSAAAQLVETIEVRVANVDVIVTDRAGNPVTGLTKADFEVVENGFSQQITNFYEIRDESSVAPPEVQKRRIVIFADQESVDPRRRADAFGAAERTLDRYLRKGDEAMVIASYRDRGVVTELTSDHDAVRRALREAATAPVGMPQRQLARERVTTNASELIDLATNREVAPVAPALKQQSITMAEAYRMSTGMARMHADELTGAQKRVLNALRRTIESMAGLEGKKILIFIGGDFQRRPGVDLLDAVDSLFRAADSSLLISGTDRHANDLGPQMNEISRTANAHGVTLYLMNAYDNSFRRSAETGAPLLGTEPSADSTPDTETAMTMSAIASDTGGRAMVAGINYDLAFENIGRDLGSYYSIGYKPEPGAGERTLTVKVKRPGLVVRSRRGYTLKTTEEETNERVIANVFHPRMKSDFEVRLETGTPVPDGEHFLLPVTVHIPARLATISDGKVRAGEFAVYFVTASMAGRRSAVHRDVHMFEYPIAEADAASRKPVIYTGSLRVRAGEQLVSVGVVDRVDGRSGFARARFTTPR